MSDDRIGRLIGDRFRLTSRLGQGGMGVVYLAADGETSGKAAVKFLHSHLIEKSDFGARFRQEARSASRFQHENVVRILSAGEDEDGSPWIAMEYCPGLSLKQIIRQDGHLGVSRSCRITEQILRAAGEAHKSGIVHRDLKPENVKVERGTGSLETVKVLDFGVAKFIGTEEMEDMEGAVQTKTGIVFGTPKYMSPEQILGEKVDGRADIYSVGAMLYEMLTGTPPFPSDDVMGFVTKHMKEPVEPPSVRAPSHTIPEEVETIVVEMLAKNRDSRPARAGELAERLAPFGEESDMPEEVEEEPDRRLGLIFLAAGAAAGVGAALTAPGHFLAFVLLGLLLGGGAAAGFFLAPCVGERNFWLRTLVVTGAMLLLVLLGWLLAGERLPLLLAVALSMILVWILFSVGWGRRKRIAAVLLGGFAAPALAIPFLPYLETEEYRRLWELESYGVEVMAPALAVVVVGIVFSLVGFVAPLPHVRGRS